MEAGKKKEKCQRCRKDEGVFLGKKYSEVKLKMSSNSVIWL